ncbi:MAG: hypothetical protein AAF557_08065 [Pseudomonadota bacterium]
MPFTLDALQERFLGTWRSVGGLAASYDSMVRGRFSEHVISVVRKEGIGWVYDHVGRKHNEANGIKLQGEVYNALPPADFEERLDLYTKLTTTSRPIKVEEIGVTGLSRRTWTSRIYVATKPPPGTSGAVVSICGWFDRCNVLELDFVLDIVDRFCPSWVSEIFQAHDPKTMQTRAKILQMISCGDFGRVSGSDLVSVSLASSHLRNSVELDGTFGKPGLSLCRSEPALLRHPPRT